MSDHGPALLEIDHLNKTYRKGTHEIPAVRDVSFDVGRGDFVSIVGRSGSGKSTLLNLVGGLDTATSGTIVFEGRDLAAMDRMELAEHRRRSVGMVFQSFNLISHRTALENVVLALTFGGVPRAERASTAARLLERMGLKDRLAHRPPELSGGEAQRVAIARALANSPSLLLLDEPTGNLDTATASAIVDLIRRLNIEQGLSVLMVTHEEDVAVAVSNKIVHLLDGAIATITEKTESA